ncbi:MAG: serine protease, partial [Campylobacter concisus]|nr:serine protease [Campylobacter concisus]
MKKFMLISLAAASLLMGADIKFNEANQDVTRVSPLSDKNSVLSYYDSIAQAKLSVVNISTTKTV